MEDHPGVVDTDNSIPSDPGTSSARASVIRQVIKDNLGNKCRNPCKAKFYLNWFLKNIWSRACVIASWSINFCFDLSIPRMILQFRDFKFYFIKCWIKIFMLDFSLYPFLNMIISTYWRAEPHKNLYIPVVAVRGMTTGVIW